MRMWTQVECTPEWTNPVVASEFTTTGAKPACLWRRLYSIGHGSTHAQRPNLDNTILNTFTVDVLLYIYAGYTRALKERNLCIQLFYAEIQVTLVAFGFQTLKYVLFVGWPDRWLLGQRFSNNPTLELFPLTIILQKWVSSHVINHVR